MRSNGNLYRVQTNTLIDLQLFGVCLEYGMHQAWRVDLSTSGTSARESWDVLMAKRRRELIILALHIENNLKSWMVGQPAGSLAYQRPTVLAMLVLVTGSLTKGALTPDDQIHTSQSTKCNHKLQSPACGSKRMLMQKVFIPGVLPPVH